MTKQEMLSLIEAERATIDEVIVNVLNKHTEYNDDAISGAILYAMRWACNATLNNIKHRIENGAD